MTGNASRIAALDGLRGVAVMGIVLMNVTSFALPDAAYLNPLARPGAHAGDVAVWTINFILVDGKMRGLFALLFGAGMALAIDRPEAAGGGDRMHFRRMAWLLGFGLAHYYLLWHGDILTLYAAAGTVAWLFLYREPGALLRWGLALLAAQMLVDLPLWLNMLRIEATGGGPWQAIVNGYGVPSAAHIAKEQAVHRGDYGALLLYRLDERGLGPLVQLWVAGAETLGLMLLGIAAARSRFLQGAWPRAWYARIALAGYALALPPMAALAGLLIATDFPPTVLFGISALATLPFRILLILAHAAAVLWWLTGRTGSLAERVAAAGRLAFTNYLGTSLVLTTLFYGYGGGFYGRLGRPALMLVALATAAAMLAWSKPWLDRFGQGPLEKLWRWLVRRPHAASAERPIAN